MALVGAGPWLRVSPKLSHQRQVSVGHWRWFATPAVLAGSSIATAVVLVQRSLGEDPKRRRRRRWPFQQRGYRTACAAASDPDLPSDEEMAQSLAKRVPPEVRISREAAVRAEQTLARADERIAALGINLEASASLARERSRSLPPLPPGGPPVALFLIEGGDGVATPPALVAALKERLPEASARFLSLSEFASLNPEAVAAMLGKDCEGVAVLGPMLSKPSAALDEALSSAASAGFVSLLRGLPDTLSRVVLTAGPIDSQAGAASAGALEKILTVTARERSPNAVPLRLMVARGVLGAEDGPPGSLLPAQVLAKMPATVREATWGLRSTLIGGLQSAMKLVMESSEEAELSLTTPAAVAAAVEFALCRGVDAPEFTVSGSHLGEDGRPLPQECWDEILLPLIGPELWRLPVENARRARAWVRQWVDFNYCRGAAQGGAAMKKAGLKTPVEAREIPLGACIKFSPSGARRPGAGFEGLMEGGLEILVDDEIEGRPGRMRVRRCAYSPRAQPKESSERTILSKLRKEWEVSESFKQ